MGNKVSMIHEYLNLLHDVPHLMFEATWDIGVALLLMVPFRRWVTRHDKEHHNA